LPAALPIYVGPFPPPIPCLTLLPPPPMLPPVSLAAAVKVAVASGIANARELIEEIKAGRAQYDFVEVGDLCQVQVSGFYFSISPVLSQHVSIEVEV